jgi:hypothetical protein
MARIFPKQEHTISICDHKNGADVTITEATDTVQREPRWTVEYYGYKNNVRVGTYIGYHYGTDYIDVFETERMGAFRADMYLLIQGGSFGTIPQEIAFKNEWFKDVTRGRECSAVSFAGGNTGWINDTDDFYLTGRNSLSGTDNYGQNNGVFLGTPNLAYTVLNYRNRPNTIRWFDEGLTMPQIATALANTIATRGWFQNFTHWHNLSSGGILYKQDDYYQTLRAQLVTSGVKGYFCSAGEAAEYMVYRSLITRKSCYTSNQNTVIVALEVSNIIFSNLLNTPVSVQIDLSTSPLAGKNISCVGCEIISLGSDDYIINIPFVKSQALTQVISVEIKEGVQEYRTETQPTINITTDGTTATIETDVETVAIVFIKLAGAGDETYTKYNRYLTYSTSHEVTGLNFTTYDYAVGVSNKFKVLNSQTF